MAIQTNNVPGGNIVVIFFVVVAVVVAVGGVVVGGGESGDVRVSEYLLSTISLLTGQVYAKPSCAVLRSPVSMEQIQSNPTQSLPVVPGQAGGGSFQKEKNYIAKKEFAYRMCARRPTSAMPKSFLCLCSPSAVPWW